MKLNINKSRLYYFIISFNAFVSLYLYFENNLIHPNFYFFSIFLYAMILFHNLSNVIFFLRTFFLGIVGFIAHGIKLIDENLLFSFHMQETQTIEITSIMFLFTNIALFASELGLSLGKRIKVKKEDSIIYESSKIFYLVFIMLFTVASLLAIKKPLIFFTQYATETVNLPIQNFNTIGNILLFILVMYFFKYKNLFQKKVHIYKISLIFISLYLLVFSELFRGARMDFLNGLIGLIILFNLYTYNTVKINLKIFTYGIVFFILLQIIGIVRSVIAVLGVDGAITAISGYLERITEGDGNGIIIVQGTINNIAATFSGTIYMLQNNLVDYYYGNSYYDYILRTPPQFLYPNRPQSLAWIFDNHGMTSGGGFFELAEAYLNFGVFGIFLVPFFISFILSYSFKIFSTNKYSLKHSIVFFSIVAVFMRGELYQTFTFYKGIITGLILYYSIYVLYGLFHLKNFRRAQPL